MHNQPNKKIPATGDRLRALRLEDMHPVLWHIRHTTVPARREKVELRLMLESELSHSITNIFLKGSSMTIDERLEALDERLEQLVDAHRALAARHEGLMMSCRSLLPLIQIDQSTKQRLMTGAYDALTMHMDAANFDDEFQKTARTAIDEVFSTI